MKCHISEIFGPTIQGEGLYTGTPSIFVRFNGCNLCCAFGNSICDTAYTSHYSSEDEFDDVYKAIDRIKELLDKSPGVSHIVFTGGEPMLQQRAIFLITEALSTRDVFYTVETNGTIVPSDDLLRRIDFWSLSPKLASSEHFEDTGVSPVMQERHKKKRFNIDSFPLYINRHCQIKFVWSGEESTEEINEWLDRVGQEVFPNPIGYIRDLWNHRYSSPATVFLMPAGSTIEELGQTQEGCVKACIENGWRFCDRLHIRIWGNKRRV